MTAELERLKTRPQPNLDINVVVDRLVRARERERALLEQLTQERNLRRELAAKLGRVTVFLDSLLIQMRCKKWQDE